jgi:hypothetical protein
MTRFIRLLALFAIVPTFVASVALAQTEERPNVNVYRADFFRANQPNTALDMVGLLPGFRLDGGNSNVRGFSGSVGNVLIDGNLPTSKQESVQDILQRIPADAVDRIELIRPGAAGQDLYGHPFLANVIRNRTSNLRGRAEAEYAYNNAGMTAPRMALNLTRQGDNDTLDISFAYGRDIEGNNGNGFRNRYAFLGGPALRLADYHAPEYQIASQGTIGYRRNIFGGDLSLSGVIRQEVGYADIVENITFPALLSSFNTDRERERSLEGLLQYEYPIGEVSQARLYFIHRSGQENERSIQVTPTDTDTSLGREGTRETILRLDARTEEGPVALEAGVEGAINILRSANELELGGVIVTLPSSNIRVAEERAEFFATATWRINSALTLEAGARNEISTITQSGDTNLTRSLAFFKPRGQLNWRFAPEHELRLVAEREVGQLDFNGFVSSASLINNNIQAGNRNLAPPRTTRLEATWEHRFWERGSITVSYRRDFIAGLLDNIPVTTNGRTFNTRGNIGSGRRDVFEANLTLPLDNIGLDGFTLLLNGNLSDTRVRDLVTGQLREFSGASPHDGEIGFTHDIPAWNIRWGGEFDASTYSTDYRIDEVSRNHGTSTLEFFVEYKPSRDWTFRIFGQQLTQIPSRRERTVYAGLRNAAPINFHEVRQTNYGALYGLNVQYNFEQ